jgi:hypothetical protein
MLIRVLQLCAFSAILVSSQETSPFKCVDNDDERFCARPPASVCGAAGKNTTVTYKRATDDVSTTRRDLTLAIAWEPAILEDGALSYSLEDYVFGPEQDDFSVTHVFKNPGTYTPIWELSHGDESKFPSITVSNCGYFPSCQERLARIVVTATDCSIRNDTAEVEESGDTGDTSDGSRNKEIFAWSVFAYLGSVTILGFCF